MIEANRMKENIASFSFPRLSGTIDEKNAFNLAKKKLESLNLNPSVQEFNFSTFYSRVYPKIAFSFGFVLLFMFFLNIETILFPIISLVIIIILILLFVLCKRPEKIRIGKNLNSQNLYVKLHPRENKSSERDILFICHLDSKGQKISILARVIAIRSWVYSAIIVIILIFLKNYLLIQYFQVLFIFGLFTLSINVLATFLILFNTTNNKSKGSIDNASGIACVFELLKYYMNLESRSQNFNMWFVFTGAEECGTMGIRNFYTNIKDFDKHRTIVFNFDVLAKSIYIFQGKNVTNDVKTLYKMFLNNKEGVLIKKNPKKIMFGSHTDGYFLKNKKFQGFEMEDMEIYKYIHTINDTEDKIDPTQLKRLCVVITNILREYDINIKNFYN